MFIDCDFSSRDGFQVFLDMFNLNHIFRMDDGDDIFSVHYKFGLVFRSLVDVRINVYDGQHRLFLMAQFITGHFQESICAPLKRLSWQESIYCKTDVNKSQLFLKDVKFLIGVCRDSAGSSQLCVDMDVVVSALQAAGNIVTNAGNHKIDPSWNEFLLKFFRNVPDKSWNDYDFFNYWDKSIIIKKEQGVFEKNMATLINGLVRFCNDNN
jgi:hypothetical protein